MADDAVRLEDISAALDGELPMPVDLTAAEAEFVNAARAVRAALRVEGSRTPPDVSSAVVERLLRETVARTRPARATVAVAAAVFVLAAAVGVFAFRPGGPAGPLPAFAQVGERLIQAQATVSSLDARIEVIERGVHPDVAERRSRGTLRYRAPERLWLHLDQVTAPPHGWPRNDFDVVVDEGTAWQRGLADCPVLAQPACLTPSANLIAELAPFASDWIAPLDLVVPVGAFLPVTDTVATETADLVTVETAAARVDRLIEGLRSAGAIRAVHATDTVRLGLDRASLTLRRLTVSAADNAARANWAATSGYRDAPGSLVLAVTVTAGDLPEVGFPSGPDPSGASAGFVSKPLPALAPPPAGYSLHRTGELQDGGPLTWVYAFTNGRAWIRVDTTSEWHERRLFGDLGPIVRAIPAGAGVGYTDPDGRKVALHTPGLDVVVSGSVEVEVLAAVAGGIARGVPIDPDWPQAQGVSEVPDGALVPPGQHLAALSEGQLVIAVGGPGRTGFQLTQRPAKRLPPPPKADVMETTARGHPARYAPRLGTLTWLEDGWMRELRADALDLDGLRAIAGDLLKP